MSIGNYRKVYWLGKASIKYGFGLLAKLRKMESFTAFHLQPNRSRRLAAQVSTATLLACPIRRVLVNGSEHLVESKGPDAPHIHATPAVRRWKSPGKSAWQPNLINFKQYTADFPAYRQ